jgi:hypothetical protein
MARQPGAARPHAPAVYHRARVSNPGRQYPAAPVLHARVHPLREQPQQPLRPLLLRPRHGGRGCAAVECLHPIKNENPVFTPLLFHVGQLAWPLRRGALHAHGRQPVAGRGAAPQAAPQVAPAPDSPRPPVAVAGRVGTFHNVFYLFCTVQLMTRFNR